jgi:hypothetical protein
MHWHYHCMKSLLILLEAGCRHITQAACCTFCKGCSILHWVQFQQVHVRLEQRCQVLGGTCIGLDDGRNLLHSQVSAVGVCEHNNFSMVRAALWVHQPTW